MLDCYIIPELYLEYQICIEIPYVFSYDPYQEKPICNLYKNML